MTHSKIDPFFEEVAEFLGVPAEEIQLRHSGTPGEFICIGPKSRPLKVIPDLPRVRNYCFTFVLNTEPPRALCDAYRQEYDQLRAHLAELIQEELWDDVARVALRLSELETAIRGTCRVRERVITYCPLPDEWLDVPDFGRILPPKPGIPPLTY